MARLHNRTALVFGAGSSTGGLSNGQAACLAYAREGARIFVVDVNPDALAHTVRQVKDNGGECASFVADVRSEAAVAAAVAQAAEHFGTVDILHNNVGVLTLGGPEELATADWDAMLEINLKGTFLACKYTLPVMVGQKRGAIVNISSIAGGRWCGRAMVGYSASKAAINQLTSEIAVQYAPYGIRCNAIVPGIIHTPMISEPFKALHGSDDKLVAERSAVIPMGRLGSAWDVANAAVFLASDDAAYITGARLPVDGGLACKSY